MSVDAVEQMLDKRTVKRCKGYLVEHLPSASYYKLTVPAPSFFLVDLNVQTSFQVDIDDKLPPDCALEQRLPRERRTEAGQSFMNTERMYDKPLSFSPPHGRPVQIFPMSASTCFSDKVICTPPTNPSLNLKPANTNTLVRAELTSTWRMAKLHHLGITPIYLRAHLLSYQSNGYTSPPIPSYSPHPITLLPSTHLHLFLTRSPALLQLTSTRRQALQSTAAWSCPLL